MADFGGDLSGEVHAAFDGVDVVRVTADQSRFDLLEETLVPTCADAGFTEAGNAFVGVDKDDGLDGCEARAVPHSYGFVLTQG